ncbi:MAG: hypothetical protein C4523_20470 [Myxococcales bacterium]|nr:MAG: hypothetical protein C4523_20470 [Myxococcales bacterium]
MTMTHFPHSSFLTRSGLPGFVAICAVAAFAIALAACGSEISVGKATKKKAAEEQTQAQPPAPAAPVAEVEKDYVYTSIGKRDPFRSIFDEAGVEATVNPEEAVLSPLQNYDVNSFRVSAIVWGVPSPTAVVAAPDNNTYLVKTGTLIGRNWGKVVKIKRDAVVVLEQSSLDKDMKVSNLIELKLPAKTIQPMESQTEIPGIDLEKTEIDLEKTEKDYWNDGDSKPSAPAPSAPAPEDSSPRWRPRGGSLEPDEYVRPDE